MTMVELAIEAVGWIAALLILVAYALLSVGKLTARDPSYQWMNVVGAVGFIVNSGWNGAIPSAALNDQQVRTAGGSPSPCPPDMATC